MKILHFISCSLLAFLFASCSEDFFDQTVEIEVPEHTPQLAITSQLQSGDTAIWVYVTHSQSILENGEAQPIEDATVELFKDGQLLKTIPFFTDRFYVENLESPLVSDAADYKLKISAPGYDAISAKQQMPSIVPIIEATYEPEGAIDVDGERVDELSIEFQDPAGEENFYEISVYLVAETWSHQLYLHRLDPIAEESGDEQYLQDDSFDGKKYTWRVGFYPEYFEPGSNRYFLVRLKSLTHDKYYYERSVSLSYDADDNPFAEPVIIHSNVDGGQGIFSLSAVSEKIVEP